MHLFGNAAGPHLVHFHVRHAEGRVVLDWEVRNAESIRWRVLRSESGFAESADAVPGSGQVLVSEGEDTHVVDDGLDSGTHYFYTVFSHEEDDTWRRQIEAKVKPGSVLGWLHPRAHEPTDADAGAAAQPITPSPFDPATASRDMATGPHDIAEAVWQPGFTFAESPANRWLRMGGD